MQEKLKTQRLAYKPFDGKIRGTASNGKSTIAQNSNKPSGTITKSTSQENSVNEANKSNDLNKSLTRSDTFVCDTTNRISSEIQEASKVPISSVTKNLIEKSSKRSLSPVLYDTLNLPKRKNLNIPSNLVKVLKYDNSNGFGMENVIKENESTLNLTPIAKNQNDTFAVSSAIKSSNSNSTFAVDNNDTTQILHSTMHTTRLIDTPKPTTLNVTHQVNQTGENQSVMLGKTGNKTFTHENVTNSDNDRNNDQTMKTIQESQENEVEPNMCK